MLSSVLYFIEKFLVRNFIVLLLIYSVGAFAQHPVKVTEIPIRSEHPVMSKNKGRNKILDQITEKPAPDFNLMDTEGKIISLSALKGKIVILDFWATWCVPCRASFPAMQQMREKYAADSNVVFHFINTNEGGTAPLVQVKKFLADNKLSFSVPFDENGAVSSAYGVMGLPGKIIIDAKGNIRFTTLGYSGHEELIEELTSAIEYLKKK